MHFYRMFQWLRPWLRWACSRCRTTISNRFRERIRSANGPFYHFLACLTTVLYGTYIKMEFIFENRTILFFQRTIYGMLTRTLTIIFVNGYGILLSAYCCYGFISLAAPDVQSKYVRYVCIVVALGVLCLLASYYDHVTFTPIVGYYASFLSVSVFAAPLAEIMQVIRTRSVETISFNIAVVSMLACTFWCIFGVLISDNNVRIYVLTPLYCILEALNY